MTVQKLNTQTRDKYGVWSEVKSIDEINTILEKIDLGDYITPQEIFVEGNSYYDSIRVVIDCRDGEVKKLHNRSNETSINECFYYEVFKTNIITEIDDADLFGDGEDCFKFNLNAVKGKRLFKEFIEEMQMDSWHNKDLSNMKEVTFHVSDCCSAKEWIDFFHGHFPEQYADYETRLKNVLEYYFELDKERYRSRDLKEFYQEMFYCSI